MITLKQLRYLAALAREKHFGRAADTCAVTQPALSMQIRELERELGADVVERRPGEVELTQVGVAVVARADAILAAVNDLVDVARHHSRTLVGDLRLGVIPTVAPYILPRILPLLQQRYPELRLDVRETQTQILLDELARGELDTALLALPLDGDRPFETHPLIEDRFLLAVPAGDKAFGGKRVGAREVDPRRLILLEEGHCLRDQALAFCAVPRNGAESRGEARLGATSLATVTQMVANGYGVTLLPELAADVELRDGRVKVIRFSAPEPARTIGLAWRKTSPRKADFLALGRIVRETLGEPEKRKSSRAATN